MRINGVQASIGNTGINGGLISRINGNTYYQYAPWDIVWNGNRCMPPTSDSVLYYPGLPGAGSTLIDYADKFSDSGIDTDEAMDISETGMDCDADATTAIPANSIIFVEGEKMFVSATGSSLTVIRGWGGTVAATHDTNQDIRVWKPNHGTITGATWVMLPTGLPCLNFDGTDDYASRASASLTGLRSTTLAIEFMMCPTVVNEASTRIFSLTGVDAKRGWLIRQATNTLSFAIHNGTAYVSVTTSAVLVAGQWYHVLAKYDKTDLRILVNDTLVCTPTAETNDISYLTPADFMIGTREGLEPTEFWNGKIALSTIYGTGTVSSHFPQWRGLVGV